MFRGKDVHEIEELKTQGFSLRAISDLTGYDRKTIRKYLVAPEAAPVYGPRPKQESKLDAFKPYLQERMQAGVWNAQVLLREIRQRNYVGGYTILTDWLRPQREAARVVAVRRFETAPGQQAQVDWGHLGSLQQDGSDQRKLKYCGPEQCHDPALARLHYRGLVAAQFHPEPDQSNTRAVCAEGVVSNLTERSGRRGNHCFRCGHLWPHFHGSLQHLREPV